MTDEVAMGLANVIAAAARAQIQCAAMQSENAQRAAAGSAPAYTEENFLALIDAENLGYNAVIWGMRR